MSRVTPPVTKFTHILRRSISSTANAGRSSVLLESQARGRYLPHHAEDVNVTQNLKKNGSKAELHWSHRPTLSNVRTIPLMQGFQTSAPKQASRDSSTIDFFFFPEVEQPPTDSFSKIRVPLLPDNYNVDRSPGSAHQAETLDEALPGPQINIVAAHPEWVMPATISEVVGNDGMDVNLEFLTASFTPRAVREKVEAVAKEPGVLKELFSGLVDDILGPKGPKVAH